MSERASHTFEFAAVDIAKAAGKEAQYHEERLKHWQARADVALETVKATIGAEVVEHEATNGRHASVVVKYGDPAAWREYQLAFEKIESHRQAADRYRTDARVYGTQSVRPYDLDTEDVHHFRLGGQGRDD